VHAQKDIRCTSSLFGLLSQGCKYTLQLCFAADSFYEEYTYEQISFYKAEAKKVFKPKIRVQIRYAESISYKEYEPRGRKLFETPM